MTTPTAPVLQMRLVVEASDFDAALHFYRDVLGLTEQAAFEGDGDARVVILDAGRATLELANPEQRAMIDRIEVGRDVSPHLRVAFEVSDAAGVTGALVDAGADLIARPVETPWRSLNSRLAAPAGLQITLFEELEPIESRATRLGFTRPERATPTTIAPVAAMTARRLQIGDCELARETFTLIADVFGEESEPLPDHYIDALLARPEFWSIAAFMDGAVVGGLTAHTLAMTRSAASEVLLYDIAVDPSHQRRGVGRLLVDTLLDGAAALGVESVFVPADDEDAHALDFYRALGGRPSAVTMFDL